MARGRRRPRSCPRASTDGPNPISPTPATPTACTAPGSPPATTAAATATTTPEELRRPPIIQHCINPRHGRRAVSRTAQKRRIRSRR